MKRCVVYLAISLLLAGCLREQPQIIVITATFPPLSEAAVLQPNTPQAGMLPLPTFPAQLIVPTPHSYTTLTDMMPKEHVVKAGETLFVIAQTYNTTVNTLATLNNLANPDLLEVGQVLDLPSEPLQQTPAVKLLPDNRLVRAETLSVAALVQSFNSYLPYARDIVTTRTANGAGLDEELNGIQIVERVSLEYSVDPRLLLAVLEYRAGWLSKPNPSPLLQTYPIISDLARAGLYKQLAFLANELNRGYYGWKGRGLRTIEFSSGQRLALNRQLNPASIAVQTAFSRFLGYEEWQAAVSTNGLYRTYVQFFGDPFVGAFEPVPANLQQPPLALPFARGEVWYYTGGAHGGWGSGSAWGALDFAPPDERPAGTLCYTSLIPVRAVADGIVARSGDGVLILDLDYDGNEATGWTILYLHVSETPPAGVVVRQGDPIGFASCAGGFSNATHLHIARRYNGEWLPTDCTQCLPEYTPPPFVMSGWVIQGIAGQEYQGYMEKDGVRQRAEQGRHTTINHISW